MSHLPLLLLPSALASEGAHGAIPWADLGLHLLNLLILLGVLAWLTRRPIRDALLNRRHRIRTELERAQAERQEAERRHAEILQRLEGFEERVRQIEEETRSEAEREAELLRERTRQDIETIRAAARRTIREELVAARHQLQEDAVNLAVQLARQEVEGRISDDVQDRLAEELLDAVRKETDAHG